MVLTTGSVVRLFSRTGAQPFSLPAGLKGIISALEIRLGVKLLARTTRLVRVTKDGQRYLSDACRTEVDEADEAGIDFKVRCQPGIVSDVTLQISQHSPQSAHSCSESHDQALIARLLQGQKSQ